MSAPVSHSAQDLVIRRSRAPHTSMFLRMLVRAAVLRRGRAASALFAMVVAAAVATAMLNLYVDVQAKLRREFRNYGANIILVGRDSSSLPSDALARVDAVLAGHGIAAVGKADWVWVVAQWRQFAADGWGTSLGAAKTQQQPAQPDAWRYLLVDARTGEAYAGGGGTVEASWWRGLTDRFSDFLIASR